MRKTERYVVSNVPDSNRDKGKLFIVTEMSAAEGEYWSTDFIHAVAQSGIVLPEDFSKLTVAGAAALGLKALGGLPRTSLDSLIARMMACVEYVPDQARPEYRRGGKGQPMLDDDIEEVSTLLKLKAVVFGLMTNFFPDVVRLKLGSLTTAQN